MLGTDKSDMNLKMNSHFAFFSILRNSTSSAGFAFLGDATDIRYQVRMKKIQLELMELQFIFLGLDKL